MKLTNNKSLDTYFNHFDGLILKEEQTTTTKTTTTLIEVFLNPFQSHDFVTLFPSAKYAIFNHCRSNRNSILITKAIELKFEDEKNLKKNSAGHVTKSVIL